MKSGNKQRFSVISPSENRFSKSSSSSLQFPSAKIELYKTLYIIFNDNACFSRQQQLGERYQVKRDSTRERLFVVIFSLSFLAREPFVDGENSEKIGYFSQNCEKFYRLKIRKSIIKMENLIFNKIKCIRGSQRRTTLPSSEMESK